MKCRLTILNCAVFLYWTYCLVYTVINYRELSSGEGWGLVGMIGLFFVGLTAFAADLIIQRVFKTRSRQNVAGIIVLIIYVLLFLIGS